MKEIRLGTIGTGVIVRNILNHVKNTESNVIEAVYSRTEEKGGKLAGEYGVQKVYTDMDAFLADPLMNTVYIASPNLLHYAQARKALLAGKNVILEKPFCTRADQAAELFEIAGEKGLILTEAVPTTYLPNYEMLEKSLEKIGRVKLVLANYSQYSSRFDQLLRGELTNIFDPQYAGGCLMDINLYNVYLTAALFGMPQTAEYRPNLFDGKYDTSGVAILEYDGFTALCAGAKDTWGVNAYQIEGEKGFIYIRDGSNGIRELRVVTKNSDETINLQPDPDRYKYEVEKMTELLLADDREAFDKRKEITLTVNEIIENIRTGAGLIFPGDR